MADETKQAPAPVPPCSCIQRTGGYWIQGCSCENSGCLADAQAWCTEQNMIEEQRRDTTVPVGWVRLHAIGGAPFVWPMNYVLEGWGNRYNDDRSPPELTDNAWCNCIELRETWAEVAALIAEAQRAQRRFDAVPVIMAAVMIGDRIGSGAACDDALAIMDGIEAQEQRRGEPQRRGVGGVDTVDPAWTTRAQTRRQEAK